MPKVRFVNEVVTVEVPVGTSLREAAIQSGIEIYRGMWTHLNCRGNGICGRCTVWILTPGSHRSLRERAHRMKGLQRLACQVRIESDLEVRTRPLGPSTVTVALGDSQPAYLAEAERRLATAREDAKKEAEKKAREAAKPKAEAKPKPAAEARPEAAEAKPAVAESKTEAKPEPAVAEAKPEPAPSANAASEAKSS